MFVNIFRRFEIQNVINRNMRHTPGDQWSARRGRPPPRLEKFRANAVIRASASCSKILKDKKYFNTVKNSRADSVLQGKRRLLKNVNDKKYIFNAVNSGHCFSGQAQVAQKSWM